MVLEIIKHQAQLMSTEHPTVAFCICKQNIEVCRYE